MTPDHIAAINAATLQALSDVGLILLVQLGGLCLVAAGLAIRDGIRLSQLARTREEDL